MGRLPLYEQIAEDLRRRVLADEFGGTLPSQDKLCELFDVSRSTIREATRLLELDGLVQARQGKATIVTASPQFDPGLEEFSSTSDLIASDGSAVGTTALKITEIANVAGGPYAEVPAPDLLRIERVRTADDVPVVYSVDIVAGGPRERAELEQELTTGSLMAWLERRNQAPAYAKTTLSAKTATAAEARRLGIARGAALMVLDECGYGPEHDVVYKSRDFYRPEIVRFHVIRKPTKR